MKILIVTQYFWPEEFGINDVALGLKKRGNDVTVLTGIPNYPSGKCFAGYGKFGGTDSYLGMRIIRAPLVPRGKGGGARLVLNYLSFACLSSIVGVLRCREKYDVIFVYEPSPITVGLPALVVKRWTRAPVILWVQDLWPESLEATGAVRLRSVLRLIERLVRAIYRGSDRIAVQSLAFSDSIQSYGVPIERIAYLPNSAEALYRPVDLPADARERGILPRGFRIMFAGNIGAAQSFETILAAAERLQAHTDIHWVILGEGRMSTWVHDEVERRGLEKTVHLLGRHPKVSMPQFFAAADAMLVSLRREKIFALTIPSKVQAYMACGRPIIAALGGEGARIVVEAGAGLACPPEDPKRLAECVLSMAQVGDDEREAMGRRGRAYFERHFESGAQLTRLLAMIEQVAGERRHVAKVSDREDVSVLRGAEEEQA